MNLQIASNIFTLGQYNNYFIGGNISNAFAIGDIGNEKDFYLIGAEPDEDYCYPAICANIFDSNGDHVLKILNNVMVWNPKNCAKIMGDSIGYEVRDDTKNNLLFSVKTQRKTIPVTGQEYFITTVRGNFYNNKGKLVCEARDGEEGETISTNIGVAFGFNGVDFGLTLGLSSAQLDIFKIMIDTRLRISEVLTGNFENTQVSFDHKIIYNISLTNCTIKVSNTDFVFVGSKTVINCKILFGGEVSYLLAWLHDFWPDDFAEVPADQRA